MRDDAEAKPQLYTESQVQMRIDTERANRRDERLLIVAVMFVTAPLWTLLMRAAWNVVA